MIYYTQTKSRRGIEVNARLRAAVTAAEQLPDEIQAEIAEVIEEEIADLAWKASLNDPRSQAVLDELEAELDAEIAAGEVYDNWEEDDEDQSA
jgi:uncharacterized protein YdeI (YjbR/CyaY-like superfamily)